MSLARFFDKAALSISELIGGMDYGSIEARLQQWHVEVVLGRAASTSTEGRVLSELLVNLLARLFPELRLTASDSTDDGAWSSHLRSLASKINPDIELPVGEPASSSKTVTIVVGDMTRDGKPASGNLVFVGAAGFAANLSGEQPCVIGQSAIPFGAAAAACLAAAATFRLVFAQELAQTAIDNVRLCTLHGSLQNSLCSPACDAGLVPPDVSVGETWLVGAGAIGNATAWVLARTPGIRGVLHIVDHETVELSNLQRYALATDQDVGSSKAALCLREFSDHVAPMLFIEPHASAWEEVVSSRNSWQYERVLMALDSAASRLAVQSSLPRWIANAWTQPANLGVSRHPQFGTEPCVACLYSPVGQQVSRDQEIANALGLVSQDEIFGIRQLLHLGTPVGEDFVRMIAQRLGVDESALLSYAHRPLEIFHREAVCGGVLLRLGGHDASGAGVQVPLAFQSALAGVLLATELVVDCSGLRRPVAPTKIEIDLLQPLSNRRISSPISRRTDGACICSDPAYLAAYSSKYALKSSS